MAEQLLIQEKVLTLNGFEKNVWVDKSDFRDGLGFLKFIEYTKTLKDGLKIQVCYTYATLDEKVFVFHSTSIELLIDERWCVIPIKNLADFLTLIRILKGDE